MKISIIIAIYKDIEALDLILNALANQSYEKEFEIVVAEDGEDQQVKNYIDNLSCKNIIHTKQKDNGWQKNKSLNNAIKHASGELLIFLDGDCIPYIDLVKNYSINTSEKTVLCGRRVELGNEYSTKLRQGKLQMLKLEKNYFSHYFTMRKDNTRHYEEGIALNTFFHKLKYRNKTSHILGCNFAVNRKDLININGFNEDYISASVGEDTDIEYRLKLNGCTMKPTRNLTNIVHLYHKVTYDKIANEKSSLIFNEVKNTQEIYCKNGIKKGKEAQ